MHYVKLLSRPKLTGVAGGGLKLALVCNVANDLGDKLLQKRLELFVGLQINAQSPSAPYIQLSEPGPLWWDPSKHVTKMSFVLGATIKRAIEAGEPVSVTIAVHNQSLRAESIEHIMSAVYHAGDLSRSILSVTAWLSGPWAEIASSRRLRLSSDSSPQYLVLGEHGQESIARHVWDGGLLAMSMLAGMFTFSDDWVSRDGAMSQLRRFFTQHGGISILELGCGVGALGIGLGSVYPPSEGECNILMTDCPDAEESARLNISSLLHEQRSGHSESCARVTYENLDWEDGQNGLFGPAVRQRRWDLVMLSDCTYNADSIPLLVRTLSAIHRLNLESAVDGTKPAPTRLFVATKHRHEDEAVFFTLLTHENWVKVEEQSVALPVCSGPREAVSIYLYEKI